MIKLNNKSENNEDLVYSEFVPLHIAIIILISLVLALLVSLSIVTWFLEPASRAITLPLNIVLLIIFVLIAINYRGIKITITNQTIEVRYGVLNKKIFAFDDILSCDATIASMKNYLGVGVRVGFDSSLAFTTSLGEAVKLTNKDDRAFVFSTKNSQEICDILSKHLEKNEKMVL